MQSQEIFKGIHLSSLVSHWPKVVLGAVVVSVVVVMLGVVFLMVFLLVAVLASEIERPMIVIEVLLPVLSSSTVLECLGAV